MVTRAVGWLNAAWADARNVMLSAAAAGDAVSPVTPSETVRLARTNLKMLLRPRMRFPPLL